jgi:ribosome-binding ATPase YchF (GTP1/OBG family)
VVRSIEDTTVKIGLVGFSGSGKSTVFQWLTGVKPDPSKVQQGQVGEAKVPDTRLDAISAHFKPKKTTFATITFLDTPGLLAEERKDNPRRLGIIRESQGLVIILDGFARTDLVAQLRKFREEILFADLEVVMNRVDKLHAQMKKPKPGKEREADEAELALLNRVVASLEDGKGVGTMGLNDEEEKSVRSFQFLTLKPELVLINRGDAEALKSKPEDLLALSPSAIQAAPKLELELEELPEEDRMAFMTDMGLKASDRGDVIRRIFYGTGRIVFLTVGEDECRTWPLMRGSTAVDGAGTIHTDLAKNFVRAEVVGYDDFKTCGYLMKDAKAKGVHRLEGKTYIVHDGDIMHIL